MGQLFSEVSNEVVADALGHIGWQIMRTGSGDENGGNRPPDKYLARAKGLINWRVGQIRSGKASAAELAQFYWWAQAELFDPAWWLPVLLLATDGFDMESRGVLGGPLAKGVLSQPALDDGGLRASVWRTRRGLARLRLVATRARCSCGRAH